MIDFESALSSICKKQDATIQEIVALLNASGSRQRVLFNTAYEKRNVLVGDKLFVRLCIEASNICGNSCLFCGITRKNKKLKRYKLSVGAIKNIIRIHATQDVDIIQLSSGEGNFYTMQDLSEIIKEAKKYCDNITIGIGHKNFSCYKKLFEDGATNYLAKFETSNAEEYEIIRPESTLKERLEHLNYAKSIGYRIASGNIVGLLNQNPDDIASDLLLMKKLGLYMAESSIFCPTAGSEFENEKKGDLDLALNCVAISRLLNCAPLILASSSLAERIGDAFMAGANYISIHAAPEDVFYNYSIYGGSSRKRLTVGHIDKFRKLLVQKELNAGCVIKN